MSTKLLTLIATILLSTFVLAGCGLQQAQAETGIEEVEERIEKQMEEIEKRLEKAESRIEEAEERAEEREERAAEERVERAAEERVESTEEERAEEAAQGESPNTGEAVLRIEGDQQTKFSGSCAVGDQEGEAIAGQVPESFDYELDGQRLKCEIRNESGGDMEVVLEAGNDHSVQRTNAQGAIIRLTYSESGISASTVSSSGSGGQVSLSSSQTSSSSSSRTQVVVTD
jgi:dsDNA-specific endonuclease/ATPase MutS2